MTIDTAKERERLVGLERRVLFGCWGCDQANDPTARPARDLAVTPIGRLTSDKEELICEYCWDNATTIDDPRFSDLSKFDPFAGCRTALDMIDAQAAEIERLRATIGALEGAVNWLDALLELVEETSCDPENPEEFDEVMAGAVLFEKRARTALTEARP